MEIEQGKTKKEEPGNTSGETKKHIDVIWYIDVPTEDMTTIEKERINKRIDKSEWLNKRFKSRHKWDEEEKTKLIEYFYNYIEQCHNDRENDFDYICKKNDEKHKSRFNIIHSSTVPDNTLDKVTEHIITKNHSLDISHIKCMDDLHQCVNTRVMNEDIFTTWKMVYTLLLNYPFGDYGLSFQGMRVKNYKDNKVLRFEKKVSKKNKSDKKTSGIVYEIEPDYDLDALIGKCFVIPDSAWMVTFGTLDINSSSFRKNVADYSEFFFGKRILYNDFSTFIKVEVKVKDKVKGLLYEKKYNDSKNIYGEMKQSYNIIKILKMEIEKEKKEFLNKKTKMDTNISKRKPGIYINNEFQEFTIGNDRSSMLENVNKYFKESGEQDKERKNVIIYRLLGRYPSFYGMCYSSVGFIRPLDKTEVNVKGGLKYLEGDGEYYKDGIFYFPEMNMYIILTEEDKDEIEIYTKNKKIKIGDKLFNNNWETFRKQIVLNSKKITGKKYIMKNFREDTKAQITLVDTGGHRTALTQ
jgi:hypothetical protein